MDARSFDQSHKLNSNENRKEQVKKISDQLRAGLKIADSEFDSLYPTHIRKLSDQLWTPVDVAIRAATLLTTTQKTRVLDISAGTGKFCAIGALSCLGQFIGIERRTDLVEIARKTARDLGANRASLIAGNFADLDWTFFDAFYLFNHSEFETRTLLGNTIRKIEIVKTKLKQTKPGTKIAIYRCLEDILPSDFVLIQKESIGIHGLELWMKSPPRRLRSVFRPALKAI